MPARPGMRPAAFGLGSGLICEHLNGQEQGGGLYRGPLTCPPSSYGSVPSCKGWGQGGNGSGSLSLYCVTLFSPITSQSFLLFHLRAWWGSLPRKMSWLLAVLGRVPRETDSGGDLQLGGLLGSALGQRLWEKQEQVEGDAEPRCTAGEASVDLTGSFRAGMGSSELSWIEWSVTRWGLSQGGVRGVGCSFPLRQSKK